VPTGRGWATSSELQQTYMAFLSPMIQNEFLHLEMKTISCLLLLIAVPTMFGFDFSNKKEEAKASKEIKKIYLNDLRLFQLQTQELQSVALNATDESSLPLLREQVKRTRLAFKRIEFLFDYTHSSFNSLFINGGPVPKFNEENDLIEPKGLQALDELIFSDNAIEDLEAIQILATELIASMNRIAGSVDHSNFSNQRIIEALRSGVVSVFTLGLTGFDTPGCGNAIEEAKTSLKAMERAFLFYKEELLNVSELKHQEVADFFRLAQQLLEANSDFDTFDRMVFLTQVINPLYNSLLDFQLLNDIKGSHYKSHAQNYNSRNLFDEDFLNIDYYAELSFLPLNNPKIIKLGKTLFYDPILSNDMKMSCASCHDPSKAFTDGLPTSKTNVANKFNRRNSLSLIDAGYASRYFWDMRDYTLERQVAHVVSDTLEFNLSFNEISQRLNQSSTYVEMFDEVYQGIAKRPIYSRTISNAIAAYVNSLKSFNSEFDQFVRNETSNYPKSAIRGFNLFMGKAACGTCHFAPVFNGTVPPSYIETESEVLGITLGLDTLSPQKDLDAGRMENGLGKEFLPHYANSFKTVTVRNSALTSPYMHNGQFDSLEEVVEFYNQGGGVGMGLNIDNQTLSAAPLNLSVEEKKDLIAFLHTLSDTSGLTNRIIKLPAFEHRPEWNERELEDY
jgi:cytochrome c peroxidase